MSRYFEVLTPPGAAYTIGTHKLAAGASGYFNGQVATLDNASGELVKYSGTGNVAGLFYEQGNLLEEMRQRLNLAAHSLDVLAGKPVGVIVGDFIATVSGNYFATAPTAPNTLIYANTDGQYTTDGTGGKPKIGVFLGTNTTNQGRTTVYLVRFHIVP